MSRLVTPDMVEQAAIDVLAAHHKRHLAKLEVQLGLPTRHIEPLGVIFVADEQERGFDELPMCALACSDNADVSEHEAGDTTSYSFTWQLTIRIAALGGGGSGDPLAVEADAMRRVRWYAMTVLECLLNRLPGIDPCGAVTIAQTPRFAPVDGDALDLAAADMALNVVVPDALTTGRGALAFHDSEPGDPDYPDDPAAPGEPEVVPGEPADPYEPPRVVDLNRVDVDVRKRPPTEDYLSS